MESHFDREMSLEFWFLFPPREQAHNILSRFGAFCQAEAIRPAEATRSRL
jgi:hypothetical protein